MTEDTAVVPVAKAPVAEEKKAWQSKTLYVSLVMAGVAFIPPVNAWIAANPGTFSLIMSGLFAVLRVVSKGKIVIS